MTLEKLLALWLVYEINSEDSATIPDHATLTARAGEVYSLICKTIFHDSNKPKKQLWPEFNKAAMMAVKAIREGQDAESILNS